MDNNSSFDNSEHLDYFLLLDDLHVQEHEMVHILRVHENPDSVDNVDHLDYFLHILHVRETPDSFDNSDPPIISWCLMVNSLCS